MSSDTPCALFAPIVAAGDGLYDEDEDERNERHDDEHVSRVSPEMPRLDRDDRGPARKSPLKI
jgi:hypothetical protein